MKDGFRQSMAWLHTWTGLLVGWVLFFVFLTGATGYFDSEITHWMKPEEPVHSLRASISDVQWVGTAQALLEREAPRAERWSISMPFSGGDERGPGDWRVSWPGLDENVEYGRGSLKLDPLTGGRLTVAEGKTARETGGGIALYRLHYKFRYIPEKVAIYFVGFCTMLMLVAILTGVVTHKKIFKDFFTFRPRKGQRSWLDAHNIVSVAALPFFLMITISGLFFFQDYYLPAGMNAAYGPDRQWESDGYINPLNPRANLLLDPAYVPDPEYEDAVQGSGKASALVDLRQPLTQVERAWGKNAILRIRVDHPGQQGARITFVRKPSLLIGTEQRIFDGESGAFLSAPPAWGRGAAWGVQDSFINLHEGMFAGYPLRWFYFLSGLLGAAMIATGLILWTVKRRGKQVKAGEVALGFRIVEILNVATIAGLPVAMAAFFWANRLLPASLEGRADWEFHCLFILWATMAIWAAARPAGKAWVEILSFAAGAFGLLPLLNALTTNHHLGVTLPAGDWALAGFDLTVLAIGACFAMAAVKVHRKWSAPAPQPRRTRQLETVA